MRRKYICISEYITRQNNVSVDVRMAGFEYMGLSSQVSGIIMGLLNLMMLFLD
jgi:hypothetical protein